MTDYGNPNVQAAGNQIARELLGNDRSLTSDSHSSHGSHTDVETADAELLADLRNGTWLSETTFPPLRWAVPGLLPEGLTLLIGPPKAGKSLLIADLLLGVAAGGCAVGALQLTAKQPVLYLALEDGDRRMKSRCEAIYGTEEKLPENFHYITRAAPGSVLQTILAFLRRYPDTAMVVLDTLGKVMPDTRQGESAYQRDYRIGGALKKIADDHRGLALVVVHHDRKATSEDFVDSVSGTNGLAGSADTIIVLCRKRKSSEAVVKVTGRDVPEEEYALLLDGVHWTLDGADLWEAAKTAAKRAEQQDISDRSAEIIDYIRQQGREVKASEITGKFGKQAAEYLRRHTENGRLIKTKRGWYAVPPT